MKVVMCDLDNVLSSTKHRESLMLASKWEDYNNLCGDDPVNHHVAALLMNYYEHGYYIFLCSGRSESVSDITEEWLCENGIPYHSMMLRPPKNKMQNAQFKAKCIDQLIKKNPSFKLTVVIDSISATCNTLANHDHAPLVLRVTEASYD